MRKLGKSVVLVGMMGAGKSSIGRRLAAALGVPFTDADIEIEAAAGCTINEIFSRYGEEAFREGERRVLARLLSEPPRVLATGGGAFVDPETRARIKKDSVSVWLKADIDLLLDRVGRRDTRPLLKTGDPRATLEKLMKERATIYAEADIAIESGGGPHGEVVKRIIAALATRAADTPP